MIDRVLPKFKNESEEARWWFEHRAEIGNDLLSAARQGRLGEGSLARRARKIQEITAPLDRVRKDVIRAFEKLGPDRRGVELLFRVSPNQTQPAIKYQMTIRKAEAGTIIKPSRRKTLACA